MLERLCLSGVLRCAGRSNRAPKLHDAAADAIVGGVGLPFLDSPLPFLAFSLRSLDLSLLFLDLSLPFLDIPSLPVLDRPPPFHCLAGGPRVQQAEERLLEGLEAGGRRDWDRGAGGGSQAGAEQGGRTHCRPVAFACIPLPFLSCIRLPSFDLSLTFHGRFAALP